MDQLLQDGGGVVFRRVDQKPSRRIPTGAFEGGAAPVVDRIAPLGQAVDRRHACSDRQAMLELPEQRFHSPGAEVGGREIERSLVAKLRMGSGEKLLGFLRRFPDLLCQGGQASDSLQALAFRRTKAALLFPALQG